MALIPYDPFRELERFFDEWASRFHEVTFPEGLRIEEPRADVYEKDGKIYAEIEMPGIDPKNIEVSIENNVLRVEGKKEEKKEEKKKGYYRKEIRAGYFKRLIALPEEVEAGKAQAKYENGVLIVEVPKKALQKPKSKKIEVKVKK